MTQLSVMELAKRGDPHAIATLINRSLESKGIHAQADLDGECLKVSLQASQIPNQKAVITIIQRGMIILQVEQIKRVKVLTYRSDNNYLAWQYEFSLNSSHDHSLTSSQIEDSAQLPQDQNTDLVKNPKGVILVQKLSQIQQNLQEYQDVIVRFTDEQVGTVRCLTTLTELIQVISKPSFLFAAVASNPNLRSLLDTIAESSNTDENGDQVITNLSILQPGQQWQKAKIRIVTKIFLEPDQNQETTEVKHQGLTLDLQETIPQDIDPQDISETSQDIAAYPIFEEPNSEMEQNTFQVNADILESNLDAPEDLESESNLEATQSDSLFDDFPDASSVIPISNTTEDSNSFSDSLFDDFTDNNSANSSAEIYSNNTVEEIVENFSFEQSVQSVIHQVNDETIPMDLDEDLFNNFPSDFSSEKVENNNSSSLESDITSLGMDLDDIKSKISKQNLNKLLMLMEEEDISSNEALKNTSQKLETDKKQTSSDMGATTIERILENMATIPLNEIDANSSSSIITLDDFSEDIGF